MTVPATMVFGYRNPRNAEAVLEGTFGDELLQGCPELVEMVSGGAWAGHERTELGVNFTFAADTPAEAEKLFEETVAPALRSYAGAALDDTDDQPEQAVLSVTCGDAYEA